MRSQEIQEKSPDITIHILEGCIRERVSSLPSKHPFFRKYRELPARLAKSPIVLGNLHLIYQAAMHATRALVYRLPHLDAPAYRQRKLRILIDDDGLPDGDTHHYQLTRAFQSIGAQIRQPDEAFGDLHDLKNIVGRGGTWDFISMVDLLYPRSLGAWCVVEMLSDDWMKALAQALCAHFPEIEHQSYFADCFHHGVEERHASEALELTASVLRARPTLMAPTLADAQSMASSLEGIWCDMEAIIDRP